MQNTRWSRPDLAREIEQHEAQSVKIVSPTDQFRSAIKKENTHAFSHTFAQPWGGVLSLDNELCQTHTWSISANIYMNLRSEFEYFSIVCFTSQAIKYIFVYYVDCTIGYTIFVQSLFVFTFAPFYSLNLAISSVGIFYFLFYLKNRNRWKIACHMTQWNRRRCSVHHLALSLSLYNMGSFIAETEMYGIWHCPRPFHLWFVVLG